MDESAQRPASATNSNTNNNNNGIRGNNVDSNQPLAGGTDHERWDLVAVCLNLLVYLAVLYLDLMFVKFKFDVMPSTILFTGLVVIFHHTNEVVQQQISKQAQKRMADLFCELILIVLALVIVYVFRERKHFFFSIMFVAELSEPQTFVSLMYIVCMSDLMLKLFILIIKIIITMMPPSVIEYKSRGKVYLMAESLSQLHRAVAPIQPYCNFLTESYSGSERIIGYILSTVYVVLKWQEVFHRFKFCKRSFNKLLQKTIPSEEQLQACGDHCPICYDKFNSPVLLECNHIFCKQCSGTWFTLVKTCPLCRAIIFDDPLYHDGTTTYWPQFY